MKLSELKEGDKLVVGAGFTCMQEGQICEVFRDAKGGLAVKCDVGQHDLDGQCEADGTIIGFTRLHASGLTFEAFLREAIAKSADVRLVPRRYTSDSPVVFYAHLQGHDGSTVDYEVRGDSLTPVVLRSGPADEAVTAQPGTPANPTEAA
jgi:hypothetical protein